MKKRGFWLVISILAGLLITIGIDRPTDVFADDPYVDFQVKDYMGILSDGDIEHIHDVNKSLATRHADNLTNDNVQVFLYTFPKKPRSGYYQMVNILTTNLPDAVSGGSDPFEYSIFGSDPKAPVNVDENLTKVPGVNLIYVYPTAGHYEIKIATGGDISDFQIWYTMAFIKKSDISAKNIMKVFNRTATFTKKHYVDQPSNLQGSFDWDSINGIKTGIIIVWLILIVIKFVARNDDDSSAGPGPNEHYDDGFFEGYVIGQIMDKNNNNNGLGGGL
ncbi:MAG: hypothetical protein LKF36_11825 [Lactobacillus sp.]|nr:hypothetical protein [Lactobacillus sp.]